MAKSGWKGESRRHSLARKGIKTAKGISPQDNLDERLVKSIGFTRTEMEDWVRKYAQDLIEEQGLDAEIIDVKIYGSYTKGKETSQSDIDFLLEYEGSEREDDMFNALNDVEDKLCFNGIVVDINPIKAEKSGTREEFMRSSGQLKIKLNKRIQKSGDKYIVYDEDDYWNTQIPFSNLKDAKEYIRRKTGKEPIVSYSDMIRYNDGTIRRR